MRLIKQYIFGSRPSETLPTLHEWYGQRDKALRLEAAHESCEAIIKELQEQVAEARERVAERIGKQRKEREARMQVERERDDYAMRLANTDREMNRRLAQVEQRQEQAEREKAEARALADDAVQRYEELSNDHRDECEMSAQLEEQVKRLEQELMQAEQGRDALIGEINDRWIPRAIEAEQRLSAALAFAEQWETLSEVAVGMIRILRGEPDGIRTDAEATMSDVGTD